MKRASFSQSVWMFLGVLALSAGVFALTYVVRKRDARLSSAGQTAQERINEKDGSLPKSLALTSQVTHQNLIFPIEESKFSHQDSVLDPSSPDRSGKISSFLEKLRAPASNAEGSADFQKQAPKEADPGYGLISLTPEFVATKLSGKDLSTGSTATLVSKSNYGLQASYSQIWTKRFQSDFYFGLSKLSIKQPSSGGTLQNADQTLYRFGVITRLGLTPRVMLSTGLGLVERPFVKAISSSVVSVDSLYVPTLFVQGSYDFFSLRPFTIGTTLGVNLDLPSRESSYRTKPNYGFDAALYVKHEISRTFNTEVGVRGAELKENTSIAGQTQTDFSIYLALRYLFGGEVEK